ncbi:MAG: hypothetical protein OXF75_09455 [Acidimicrobiaceae bacterium]|nr:hypothetical protein [Acidimicrobiaceae bacterium]
MRVRMWVVWRLEAARAANRAGLKQGPLSVAGFRAPVSPVSGSARSATQVMPRGFSASARAQSRDLMASAVVLVRLTSQAGLALA